MTLGDGSTSKVIGKGNISSQRLPSPTDILLVEDLKANHISISQLCDAQHQVQFFKTECSIFDKNGVCVMKGAHTSDNCYGITSGSGIFSLLKWMRQSCDIKNLVMSTLMIFLDFPPPNSSMESQNLRKSLVVFVDHGN